MEISEDYIKQLDSTCAWKPCGEDEAGFRFQDLGEAERGLVLGWVDKNITSRKSVANVTSYGLKHMCEKSVGFYVSNLQMKVAMRLRGHEPVNPGELNHCYRIYVSKSATRKGMPR